MGIHCIKQQGSDEHIEIKIKDVFLPSMTLPQKVIHNMELQIKMFTAFPNGSILNKTPKPEAQKVTQCTSQNLSQTTSLLSLSPSNRYQLVIHLFAEKIYTELINNIKYYPFFSNDTPPPPERNPQPSKHKYYNAPIS